jgi:hypothetical protein
MKNKEIKFTATYNVPEKYNPGPASKFIPDWYRKMESYIGEKKIDLTNNGYATTIKKCIPVFDAITAGYILVTPADIEVSQVDGSPYYQWPSASLIHFHPIEQAPEHPDSNGFSYPKFINPWIIETPPGYSSWFTQPMHRNSVFTILDGFVDTDTYKAPVNFPFVLNDPTWTGTIPAGTPMAQVIPIKRDSWKMKFGGEQEIKGSINSTTLLTSKFVNKYKTLFWNKKDYK